MAAQLRLADDWYRKHPPVETNLDALAQQLGIDVLHRPRSLGLPNTLPLALALASPAFTRSRIMARSNSENTPNI